MTRITDLERFEAHRISVQEIVDSSSSATDLADINRDLLRLLERTEKRLNDMWDDEEGEAD